MIVLEKDDVLNMLCGFQDRFKLMEYFCSKGQRGFYYYCDKDGRFELFRHELAAYTTEELLEMYMELKNFGKKPETAMATVLDHATAKRAFFKCSNCGTEKIAQEDKYCPECGKRLVFEFDMEK